jgi:hypothetical protein
MRRAFSRFWRIWLPILGAFGVAAWLALRAPVPAAPSPAAAATTIEDAPAVSPPAAEPQREIAPSAEGASSRPRIESAELRVVLATRDGSPAPRDWVLHAQRTENHWRDEDPEAVLRALEAELEDDSPPDDEPPNESDDLDGSGDPDDDELGVPIEFPVRGQDETLVSLHRGRYRLHAVAERGASAAVEVRVRAGAAQQEVRLEIAPFASVVGRIAARGGWPLAGLPLILERGGDPRTTLHAAVEPDGAFRFERVIAGGYRLCIGSVDRPLLPRIALDVVAPLLDLGAIELASLGAFEVTVLDREGAPVVGARVRTTGNDGGHAVAITGERGVAVANFLPAGDFRVFAFAAERGRGSALARLVPGTTTPLEIRLR